MFDLMKRIAILFQKRDRISLVVLFLGIFLNSFLEILGIGVIVPFIALLSNPKLVETNRYLSAAYHLWRFESFSHFMVVMAAIIVLVFIVKNAMLLMILYFQNRFVTNIQTTLSTRLFRAYLMSPYSFHLHRNVGHFQEKIQAVGTMTISGLFPAITILTEGFLVFCLLMVLLKMNALLTITAAGILSGAIYLQYFFFKERLTRWGTEKIRQTALLFQQINQGLGSIKECKLLGKEQFFVDSYQRHFGQLCLLFCKNELASKSPRMFIETIVVGVVIFAMVLYLLFGRNPDAVFATISVFALASLRLMPSINRLNSSWAALKFFKPSFDAIYEDLVYCEDIYKRIKSRKTGGPIVFNKEICLQGITFHYEGTRSMAINNVSLTIKKNSVVGFVGPSGAGKTTVVDIILGLLDPSAGKVLVDGEDIHTDLRSWQSGIGYIPQTIFLCDDSIRNNIAFGVERKEISDEKAWEALRLAQLDVFVRSLPQGLDTEVGERGVRLSGGQRQRIGIARTLYHDLKVLVMDEATAALDNETERSFMEALLGLCGQKTIIIIAHRLTTVQRCERIFFLKGGQLVSDGTYDQLRETCPDFQEMAGIKSV